MTSDSQSPIRALDTNTSTHLKESTAKGAKGIFFRFVLVSMGVNALLGIAVVVYNVADHLSNTRQILQEEGEKLGRVARRMRLLSTGSDEYVMRKMAILLNAPVALLDRKDGVVRYASDAAIGKTIPIIYKKRPTVGTTIRIERTLKGLSGAWVISRFSDEHDFLVIIGRLPEDEGIAVYMTISAGLAGLGILLSFIIILAAANWMLRRPLSQLVKRLTGALARDVLRRQRAEDRAVAARKEAEEHLTFLNSLIDASESVGIVAVNTKGKIQIFNWAAVKILGYNASEVVGKMSLNDLRGPVLEAYKNKSAPFVHPGEGEELWFDKQGNEHLLSINRNEIKGRSGRPRGLLITFIDVTERRKLEADLQLNELQLIQSAKLATLGEMATGIAHEINQPLNNIGLLASRMVRKMVQQKIEAEDTRTFFRDKLKKVQEQVQRAGQIIDHLRMFGRPASKKLSRVAVYKPVEGVMVFLREQLARRGIEVLIEIPEDLPLVQAEEGRLEQVLMNLIINARDALLEIGDPEHKPQIRVIGETRVLKDGSPGVGLQVIDNGPGMPREVVNRIFEPFFTTKEVGKGTGLGLSISYGLVREFGGRLEVESRKGEGTAFCICLRLAPDISVSPSVKSTHDDQDEDTADR